MVWNYTKCLYGGKGGGRLHKDLKSIVQDSGQVAGGGGSIIWHRNIMILTNHHHPPPSTQDLPRPSTQLWPQTSNTPDFVYTVQHPPCPINCLHPVKQSVAVCGGATVGHNLVVVNLTLSHGHVFFI